MTAFRADTHVVIWAMDGDRRLTFEHLGILASNASIHVSTASLWGIAIKKSLGKLKAPPDMSGKLELVGFKIPNISTAHAEEVETLPHHHRDPFDRMIIAQARCEVMTILTVDRHFSAYEVAVA